MHGKPQHLCLFLNDEAILDLTHILYRNRGKHFEVTVPSTVAHSHVPPSNSSEEG